MNYLPSALLFNDKEMMDANQLKAFAQAQIREIEKFKWCLGVNLGHDPLEDLSMNDIASNWIEMHSAQFRKHWQDSVKIA